MSSAVAIDHHQELQRLCREAVCLCDQLIRSDDRDIHGLSMMAVEMKSVAEKLGLEYPPIEFQSGVNESGEHYRVVFRCLPRTATRSWTLISKYPRPKPESLRGVIDPNRYECQPKVYLAEIKSALQQWFDYIDVHHSDDVPVVIEEPAARPVELISQVKAAAIAEVKPKTIREWIKMGYLTGHGPRNQINKNEIQELFDAKLLPRQ